MVDVPPPMPSEEFLIAMAKDAAIGPFWGAFGACLAQGYIFHLAVRYYQLPASRWERLIVSVGLLGTILGTALVNHDMYQQTVVYYAGFENMAFHSWMAGANCLVGGVVTLCTEAVFAFRLIRLHHGNTLIAIPLVVLVIGTFASHFPTATKLRLLAYYAIESMALPTTCAVVAIILKIVRPQTSEHLIFLYWQKFVSMTVLLLVLLR
ncbi:hypothetical protein NCC49_006475 [Naganishia albida]|nr:hypothetical protein NCC49_006475 [Naganishia albida]